MGWFRRLFSGSGEDGQPIAEPHLDAELRRSQLVALESALSALIQAMSQPPSPLDNPGWQGKIRDYNWVCGQIRTLIEGTITHDGVYDLILGVQPVFRGEVPEAYAYIEPLQREVLDAVRAMQNS
ncbi:MAG: hypothetical protein Q4B08_00330 [Propionibacteriaceae bacterium]|nr:hypothetical protein [Propionibacteriaceae bacterium]